MKNVEKWKTPYSIYFQISVVENSKMRKITYQIIVNYFIMFHTKQGEKYE